jgi:hypothetical protein
LSITIAAVGLEENKKPGGAGRKRKIKSEMGIRREGW